MNAERLNVIDPDKFYRLGEAGDLLGLDRKTIRNLIERGYLCTGRGLKLILGRELERYRRDAVMPTGGEEKTLTKRQAVKLYQEDLAEARRAV